MKRFLTVVLAALAAISFTACSGVSMQSSEAATTSQASEETTTVQVTTESATTTATSIDSLKVGDEVSITGQVAGSTLVNGDTLWVQVQSDDGSYVRYDCQLKSEFIADFELLQTVKVKGYFVSLMDLEQENTMPIVTLSDCEIEG